MHLNYSDAMAVRPKARPTAKARDGGREASSMGAAGLMVLGGRSLPAQPPPAEAPAARRPRAASPKPEYRAWAAKPSSAAAPVPVKPTATDLLSSSDEQVIITVVMAMSGKSLATFPTSLRSTGADVLQRLTVEAPLPATQRYKLMVKEEVFEKSTSLQRYGLSGKDESLEIAAFVEICTTCTLSENVAVQQALEGFRELPGHLEKPAHQRDFEFHDWAPRPVTLTLDAACALLKIPKREAALGRYGDLSAMVQPLPLLDPGALIEYLSQAVVESEDISQMLFALDPILKDGEFGEAAISRWANSYSGGSERRVGRTCIALSRWCVAAANSLREI